jgi:translation initiation factor 1
MVQPKAVRVYASGVGAICAGCGQPAARCACRAAAAAPGGDGTVRVGRETKGRKGRGVTVISGVPGGEGQLAALARELKQLCGTGGTVKAAVIEIQGDHRDRIVGELQRRGLRVKRCGG